MSLYRATRREELAVEIERLHRQLLAHRVDLLAQLGDLEDHRRSIRNCTAMLIVTEQSRATRGCPPQGSEQQRMIFGLELESVLIEAGEAIGFGHEGSPRSDRQRV